VQGHGGLVADVKDAVDVRGREIEGLAGSERADERRASDGQSLLADRSRGDRDRARGKVVIVEPRVVVLHPADQPYGDVVVTPKLLVDAPRPVVSHEVSP
jgi:hypothetical protein